MVHITSMIIEKLQFNQFPNISLGELSVAMASKPRGKIIIILAIFKSLYTNNILTLLGTNRFYGFGEVVLWNCWRADTRSYVWTFFGYYSVNFSAQNIQ